MLAKLIADITHDRRWLIFLTAVNLTAAVYGFFWYRDQLVQSPFLAWIIIADSPMSCLYLAVAQIAFLRGRRAALFEGLGYLGMMVYGLWASCVLLLYAARGGHLLLIDWLLITGHAGMFLEGLLYLLGRGTELWAVGAATVWFLFDHWLDYGPSRFHPTFPNTELLVPVRNVTVCGTLVLAAMMAIVVARHRKRPEVDLSALHQDAGHRQ